MSSVDSERDFWGKKMFSLFISRNVRSAADNKGKEVEAKKISITNLGTFICKRKNLAESETQNKICAQQSKNKMIKKLVITQATAKDGKNYVLTSRVVEKKKEWKGFLSVISRVNNFLEGEKFPTFNILNIR